ncbi:4-hydroxy-tetrahydrodipicolinate synthase [Gelria sp. Kuro-4]|uniref:4-hydroxy-tetrahydrodipicolinate synthase n=1 Tax=Gelria sp. Kuro-4 TaxID=2796927 RepID=UPI001BEE785D|nr:4-hydroxy-tetrahydrodipicolinate synthase [Gelria sp. Kuro-4]BCV24629.1 dihydrodipicolinate synthase family protein [Gelria sp. Kuro-4]
MTPLHGIIVAMLTPYGTGGEVNLPALREYVDFLIARGVHGLFPTGTNGEGPALTLDERKQVIKTVVEQAAGRVPVIAHTGAITTAETIELTRYAQAAGARAAAVVSPYYFPHDEAALESHFSAVAEAVPGFPLYLYNIPGNAKNDLKPGFVARLRQRARNIVGIKDSSKDLTRLEEYIAALGPGFTTIVGTDTLILPALVMGAAGVVSAVANVFPEPCVALYRAWEKGDLEQARTLQYHINRIRTVLKAGPYITPYRAALAWRGLPFAGVRPPFRTLSASEEENLKQNLRELKEQGILQPAL